MSDDRLEQDELDPRIARFAEALRPLPAVNGEAKARVLVAVAAEREADRRRGGSGWRRSRIVAGGGLLAAAVTMAAIWIGRSGREASTPVAPVATTGVGVATAALATRDANAEPAPMPVELMLNAPTARRVRLVGDFTGWDEKGIEMRRDVASGLWSATASVRPGRHVYAFIVDDSVWMRDPRAPVAPDSDFGQPGSLLIVGRP